MTSEPSAVQRPDFRHTAATTLSWHSGSTTGATDSRSDSRRKGVDSPFPAEAGSKLETTTVNTKEE